MNRQKNAVILFCILITFLSFAVSCGDSGGTSTSNKASNGTGASSTANTGERQPWEAPIKATVKLQFDIHTILDKSQDEVNRLLGQPKNIPSEYGSECPSCIQNIYQTEMGRFSIVFVNNKAYWIIIDGIYGLPFSEQALANIGLPITSSDKGFPGFMEWDNVGGVNYIAFASLTSRSYETTDDISVLGTRTPGQPFLPVNVTGRLDTPDTIIALLFKNAGF